MSHLKRYPSLPLLQKLKPGRYNTTTQVKCYECGIDDVDKSSGKLSQVVDTVLKANTFAQQEEVKAWEQELTVVEHTLCLEQDAPRDIESQNLGHCSILRSEREPLVMSYLRQPWLWSSSIWRNWRKLGTGWLIQARTGHPIAVKLGSLTADGTADIYCYACDEERVDPELPTHLAHWGINIKDRVKTEKSLTEMQVEHNLLYEFSMTTGTAKNSNPCSVLVSPG